jgi:hypothetical protein
VTSVVSTAPLPKTFRATWASKGDAVLLLQPVRVRASAGGKRGLHQGAERCVALNAVLTDAAENY